MLNTFIERWSGPLLIVLGLVAIAHGGYGLLQLADTPAIVSDMRRMLGAAPDPAVRLRLFLFGGMVSVALGVALLRYFGRPSGTGPRPA